MDLVDVLKERKGDASQVEFAGRLGIDQSMLSLVLNRKAGIGPKVAAGIIRAFPDLREVVVDALVAEKSAA